MESRRRDLSIAIALVVAIVALLLVGRADGTGGASRNPRSLAAAHWSADPLPPGWHEVDRPLADVLVPAQVFAAATYPIVLHHPPRRCGPPPAVLSEMPPGGLLLQVVEYPARALDGRPLRVPRLPRRPARFSWADATWAAFECAGPSYKFDYHQGGRALQAQVWTNRATADPALRAGALRILDDLRRAGLPHSDRPDDRHGSAAVAWGERHRHLRRQLARPS